MRPSGAAWGDCLPRQEAAVATASATDYLVTCAGATQHMGITVEITSKIKLGQGRIHLTNLPYKCSKHSTLARLFLLCNFVTASQGNIDIYDIIYKKNRFIAQKILYKSTVIHEQTHISCNLTISQHILLQWQQYYQHRAGETSQPELIGNFTCWATDRCWFRQLRFLIV